MQGGCTCRERLCESCRVRPMQVVDGRARTGRQLSFLRHRPEEGGGDALRCVERGAVPAGNAKEVPQRRIVRQPPQHHGQCAGMERRYQQSCAQTLARIHVGNAWHSHA